MRLTVIVPATDAPPTLQRALTAIAAAAEGPDELIVVHEAAGPGPGAARNAGALRAQGEILMFVDADVEVHPDVFSRVRQAFAVNPGLTAVFGSYDDDPDGRSLVSSFRNLLHHHVHQRWRGPATSFWVGLGAVRRSAFEASGGFDAQRYPTASIEDIELGVRLIRRGAWIQLDRGLQGKHLKHWSALSMLRTDVLLRGVPWTELVIRERRLVRSLSVCGHAQASAGATAWLAWALTRRQPRAIQGATALSLLINVELYTLLFRRRGVRMALAGPVLHAVYNLAAISSLPFGLATALVRLRLAARTTPPDP